MALATAEALVAAESEGLPGHGLSRVALYAQHLREGRVDGKAKPAVVKKQRRACLVDARGGLAFPAAALAVKEAIKRAQRYGIAFCGVTNSHHFGAAAYHLAPVAEAGLVGLAFTNSPAAINAWGGKKAFFGTNPDRGDLSAARRRARRRRSFADRSRARQDHGLREGRQADPARLGAWTGTATRRPTRRRR